MNRDNLKAKRRLTILIVQAIVLLSNVVLSTTTLWGDEICNQELVRKWTVGLKLAMFRMDIADMKENLDNLKKKCPDQLLKDYCDADCYITLGKYHYFEASDLQFLYFSHKPTVNEIETQAMAGIKLVEEGIRQITNQIFVSDSSENSDLEGTEMKIDFNQFINNLVKLKMLQTRFYMVIGDAYYSSLSNPYSQYLQFKVSEGANPANQDSYMGLAYLNYNKALQIVLDALSDLPRQSDPNLKTEVNLLKGDIQTRLDSILKGYIYLNINPMKVTQLSFHQLENEINKSINDVKAIESHITGYMERAKQANENRSSMELNDSRWFSEKQTTIKSQKIAIQREKLGQMIQLSSQLATEMNYEDWKNKTVEQQIHILSNFEQTVLGLEAQKENLSIENELSLVGEEFNAAYDNRNEVRFKVNRESTMAHLRNEQDSILQNRSRLVTENINYMEETNKIDKQTQIYGNENTILDREYEKNEMRRAILEEKMSIELGDKVELYLLKISKLEDEIDYYEELGDNQSELCGVQEKLNDLEKEQIEQLSKTFTESGRFAMEGVTESQKDIMISLLNKEKELAEKTILNISAEIETLKNTYNQFDQWYHAEDGFLISTQSIVNLAGLAYQLAANVPRTSISVMAAGMASGTSSTFEVDPARLPRALYNIARDLSASMIQINALKYRHLKETQQMQDMLDKLDLNKSMAEMQRDYTKFQVKKKLIEIGNIEKQYANELLKLDEKANIIKLQCSGNKINTDWMIERSKLAISELEKEISLSSKFTNLTNYDLQILDESQKTIELRKDNYNIEIDKLNNDRRIIENRMANNNQAIASMDMQLGRLMELEQKISELYSESDRITQVIENLRQNKLALIDNQRQQRLEQIEDMMRHHQSLFQQLSDNLQKAAEGHAALQERILEVQGFIYEYQDQIVSMNEYLLEAMSVTKDELDARKELFAVLDLEISDFLPSLGYWVENKKRALHRANYYLSLYRVKLAYALLRPSLVLSDYAVTGDQLTLVMHDLHDKMLHSSADAQNVYLTRFAIGKESKFIHDLNKYREVYFQLSDSPEPDNPFLFGAPLYNQLYEKRIVDLRIGYTLLNGCAPVDDIYLNLTHVGISQFNNELGISSYMISDEDSRETKLFLGTHEDNQTLMEIKRRFDGYYYRASDLSDPSSSNTFFPLYGKGLNSLWRLSLPYNIVSNERVLPVCNGKPHTVTDLFLYVWFSGNSYE